MNGEVFTGKNILEFALVNREITSHEILAELALPGSSADIAQQMKEVRRALTEIPTDTDEWFTFIKNAKESLKVAEDIDIEVEMTPTEIISQIFDQRRKKYENNPEDKELADQMVAGRRIILADEELAALFNTFHQVIKVTVLVNCEPEKDILEANIRKIHKAASDFRKKKNSEKKQKIMSILQKSDTICEVSQIREIGYWANLSETEVMKLVYNDRASRRTVDQILKRNRLANSQKDAMVRNLEAAEKTAEAVEEAADTVEEAAEAVEEAVEAVEEAEEAVEEVAEAVEEAEEAVEEATDTAEELKADYDGKIECRTYPTHVEYRGYICDAEYPDKFVLDTNILMNQDYLRFLANTHRRSVAFVSKMGVYELHALHDNGSKDIRKCVKRVLDDLYEKGERYRPCFLRFLHDNSEIRDDYDHDYQIVCATLNCGMVFVTNDAGAAAIARTMRCPYILIKKPFTQTDMIPTYTGPEKTIVLDADIFGVNMRGRLLETCSQVVITSAYAVSLNRKKENPDLASEVKAMQLAIATDLSQFFTVYKCEETDKETKLAYENEMIELCTERKYTFVTGHRMTWAWFKACSATVDLWYHKSGKNN